MLPLCRLEIICPGFRDGDYIDLHLIYRQRTSVTECHPIILGGVGPSGYKSSLLGMLITLRCRVAAQFYDDDPASRNKRQCSSDRTEPSWNVAP